MAPQQHLAWFEDNIRWFESIPEVELGVPVPNCPGWSIETVLNHLSYGLGLGYPIAMSKPAHTAMAEGFAGLAAPEEYPSGVEALREFSTTMGGCLRAFSSTDPDKPCWTYAGPGTVAFWMRRAAIETTLHRMDVEDALRHRPGPDSMVEARAENEVESPTAGDIESRVEGTLTEKLAADAIEETVEFALPLAARMTSTPKGALTVLSPELDLTLEIGSGSPEATIVGTGEQILTALWGRGRERVEVRGDHRVAADWMALVERVFVGR